MRNYLNRFFCLLLFFSCTAAYSQAPKTLPAFNFKEVFASKDFSSTQLPQTGTIVIDFYDPGCGHCQKMGAGIARNLSTFKNVYFYFISMNEKPYVEGFIDMYAKNLRGASNVKFLFDSGTQFIEKFRPTNYPSLYIYDARNKNLTAHLDGEDDIEKLKNILNKK